MTLNHRPRSALPGALLLAALVAGAALHALRAGPASGDAAPPTDTNGAVSPKDEADSLHFVIAADREAYCRVYLALRSADAHSQGGSAGPWPCPSVTLHDAAEAIQMKGAEFSYALRSPAPLNPRNGPQTELEQAGLAFVASHPGQNYYGREMLGGRRYFTAVYPDLPAAAACVECHDRLSGPAPLRHKAGEALGAVVVRVPLEF
jgi:hypothetical protein